MAYLIWQLIIPLLLTAILGGVAGWCWHCITTAPAWAAKDAERDRLRNEILSYVGVSYGDRQAVPVEEHSELRARHDALGGELAQVRASLADREQTVAVRDGRIAELEMALSGLRSSMPDAEAERSRVAALESALSTAQAHASAVEQRATMLQQALDAAAAAPKDDAAQLRWRIHELETALAAQPPSSTVLEDEHNRLKWKARYLGARVDYLEGQPVPEPAAPVDEEAENRKRWRQRYLEARVAWLEGRMRDHAALRAQHEQEIDARDQHIAALSQEAGRPRVDADEHEALRARLVEVETAYRALHQRATEIDANYRTLRQQAGELETAHNTLRTSAAELKDTHDALQQHATAIEADAEAMKQRIAELEGLLAAARAETGEAVRRRADLEGVNARQREEIAQLEARLRAPPPEDPEAGKLRWQSRYLDSRVRFLEQTAASPQQPPLAPMQPRDGSFAPLAPAGDEVRPAGLPAARGGAPDDLRMIAGVGPRIESTLNSLGVYHFDQIAAWSPANVAWIERYLAFKGRIAREDWIEQARALAAGQETDGMRRYLAGEQT